MKAAIRTFCNEGYGILTSNDMQTALKERPVKGTTAAVCSVDEPTKTAEVKKIEGFSKLDNFFFKNKGIRIWRCYGISNGKLVPYTSLIVQPQSPSSLITKEPFFPINQSRVLKPEKKAAQESPSVLICPEPGCTKTFVRFADFELHLDVEEHVSHKEPDVQRNLYDKIKRDWVGMFAKIQTEECQQRPCSKDSVVASNNEPVSDAKMGWALARSGPSQFTEKVKDYLTKKFDLEERTGQEGDAQQVAMDMHSARTLDNQRIFCRDDWLTKAQVQGFFSRFASARRKQGLQRR